IPTVFIGGPLAVLAMLFPTVFGGWQRWLAVISVACTVSTLYFVQYLFAGPLAGTWWGSPAALWAGTAATTAVGAVWAWVRFANRVQNGQAASMPSRAETISLLVLSLIAGGMVVYCSRSGQSLTAPAWLPFLVFAVGAWVATPYVLYRRWVLRASPAVATEAVMLMAMLLACTGLGAGFTGRTNGGPGTAEPGEAQQGADNHAIRPGQLVWSFRAPDQGAIASSPLVAGERVYIAAATIAFSSPTVRSIASTAPRASRFGASTTARR